MNSRRIYGYGLIAGLSYDAMRGLPPGFILDQYVWRSQYDISMAAAGMAGKLMR